MSVSARQEVTQSVSTAILNGASALIEVPRPRTLPAGPPAVNTKDHVAENPFNRKEFEGGLAQVFPGANFVAATVFVTRIAKVDDPEIAPQDPDSSVALFPNGAAQSPEVDVVYSDATGLPTNGAEAIALLTNLTVRANQSLEITLRNASGGPLTDVIRAHWEMGRNQADIVLRDQA